MRFILILLSMLLLTGCTSSLESSAYGERQDNGSVEVLDPSMSADIAEVPDCVFFAAMPAVYPVGQDSVTFQMYYFGEDAEDAPAYTSYWTMEVWEDGAWRVIPLAGIETRPDYLRGLGTKEDQKDSPFSIALSRLDHDFGAGQYRLLKEFGGVMYAAGFTISDEYN